MRGDHSHSRPPVGGGFACDHFVLGGEPESSLTEINKKLTNPVSDLWSIAFQQNNYMLDKGATQPDHRNSKAKALGEKAKGILVFPGIVKAGFLVGGQFGEGALIKGGKWAAYYNTVSASYGLQVGLQKYGYALFFMSESAMSWLDKSDAWEIGVGPSIVVVDTGMAKAMTTTTLQSEIYALFFDQKGLMGGLGLQGTKITRMKEE